MKHFRRDEFECKCEWRCGFDTVDFELAEVMDSIREHFDKPISITSGFRCVKSNKNTDGASLTSKHMLGMACDFKVEGVHADIVADYLEKEYPNKYGIGRYNGRTHIDVRKNKARWDKR